MLGNTLVGRYQIISHLGGGGFGETFVAYDTQLPGSPHCVVKRLKPQASDPVTLETARRLFDTEAKVLYKLGTHDRIPQLLAYFEENAEFYLVQEFIEGNDLSEELAPGKTLSQAKVIFLLQEILEILEFVHEQKVIHRDVNPRNLLRRQQDGKLVLIDFGAVKQITTQVITPEGETKSTVAIGTPGYMPGEQAQGTPKFSSDIYAVGIIAMQALTGLSPEEIARDPDTNEVIWQKYTTVSPEFVQVLDKMVCYDFRQRYPSATAALQALKELTQPSSHTIALTPAYSPLNPPTKKPKKGLIIKILLGIFVMSITGGVGIFIFDKINSKNAIELSNQANTLFELQRYQDALAAYEKVVNIRPDYAQAWNGQGRILYELKEYKQALTAYDKAIQIQPDYLQAWSGRGLVLAKLQRHQEAIASFNKALQLQNNSPEVWNAKGESFLNLNQYDNAIKSYDKAIELKPDYYESWYNKGLAMHDLRRYPEAIESFNQVIKFNPDNYEAWYSRGWSLHQSQRYEEAVISYNKAISLKGKDYQIWYNLGNSLYNLQKYQEAIAAYNKAVRYKNDHTESWYSKGNALVNLKRYKEAIAAYDQAIKYKPDYQQAIEARNQAQSQLQPPKPQSVVVPTIPFPNFINPIQRRF